MMDGKCKLTDAELHDAVQKWVSKLCDTGGSAWALSVPVNFDHDPDMLITELCKRQSALLARRNALVEAVAGMFAAQDAWAQKGGASYPDWADGRARYDAARAEVDRLIADCKEEKCHASPE